MKAKRLHPDAQIDAPRLGDAGFDIYCIEDCFIPPGEARKIKTGIAVEIPPGWVGILKDRSSMGANGLEVCAGVIDSGYRGEITPIIRNHNPNSHLEIRKKTKIIQMVIVPYYHSTIQYVDNLSESDRGDKGFGSTG